MSSVRHESSRSRWFSSKNSQLPTHKPIQTMPTSIPSEKLPTHSDNVKHQPGRFYTLASVIGIGGKPRKQPALPVHNPPPKPDNERPVPPRYTNRPPARSISSTVRTRDDSIELHTPLDAPRDRLSFPRSVFTVSDTDPFAAEAIAFPRGAMDPTRLSVHSNNSFGELNRKVESNSAFSRSSFASTSSQSNYDSGSVYSEGLKSPLSSSSCDATRRWSPKKAAGQIVRQGTRESFLPQTSSELTLESATKPSLSKSGSSLTLTDKNRGNEPSRTPHPQTRPRGKTDAGHSSSAYQTSENTRQSTAPASFVPPALPTSRPRTLSRQASVSRVVTLPPSAPPAHDLPPPPKEGASDDHDLSSARTTDSESSSSSISFASSKSSVPDFCEEEEDDDDDDNDEDYYSPRYKSKKDRQLALDRDFATIRRPHKEADHGRIADVFALPSKAALSNSIHHNLKKAVSHQSLTKGKPCGGSTPTLVPPLDQLKVAGKETVMRKQRSFHQPRFPAPPVPPLRHANSCTPTPASPLSPTESLGIAEQQRRGSATAPPFTVRRRLFSGSSVRRPSASVSADEDLRSVFSLPTESEVGHGVTSLGSFAPSIHDDIMSETRCPSPTTSTVEYTPQHIMSPAEMLKVEASVQSEFETKYGDTLRTRSRGQSFASSSTPMLTTQEKEALDSLMPPLPRITPSRSASMILKGQSPPQRLALRPATAQGSTEFSPVSPTFGSVSLSIQSAQFPAVGLPPPPRPRLRPQASNGSNVGANGDNRSSNVPIVPLSPPPRKNIVRSSVGIVTTSPHKFMIRKPSFLEITDHIPSSPQDSSFLDMDGRDSLDTNRDFGDED